MQGAGKSHLLHAASNLADSLGKSSLCLAMSELTQLSVEVLDGLEQIDLICIDDIQLLVGNAQWQQAIFDLFNRVKEQGKHIIIAGDCSVNDIGLETAGFMFKVKLGLC